jgi:hypothetical protein
MRLAARYADGFDLGRRGPAGAPLTADEMATALAEVRRVCDEVGRDRPIALSHWTGAELDGDDTARRQAVERFAGYARAGLDRLLLALVGRERGPDLADPGTLIRRLENVIARL